MINSITDTEISVTFTDVPAMIYRLYVDVVDLGFSYADGNKNRVWVDLIADTAPIVSSFAGGNSLTFTGYGFDVDTVMTVCDKPCEVLDPVTDITYNSITCQTPTFVT